MARINVEESVYKDPRFFDLAMKLGSKETALGAMVFVWSEAQKFWKTSSRLIPLTEWSKLRFCNEIVSVGLAEIRGEEVYVRGSSENFRWLQQRQEAGRKSRIKSTKHKSKSRLIPLAPVNGTQSSSSSSSSYSSSCSNSSNLAKTENLQNSESGDSVSSKPQVDSQPGTNLLIAHYVNKYRERYGQEVTPPIGGKNAGLAKRLVKDYGLERSKALVDTFLTMNKPWMLNKAHDLGSLVTDIASVALKLDSGQQVSQAEIQQIDSNEYYKNQLKRIASGEL